MLVVACAPTHHTPALYRDDRLEAARIEGEATARCQVKPPPSRPFRTDGCTLWPDSVWQQCCVDHDIAYWCGGTKEHRAHADRELRNCVDAHYSDWRGPFLGGLMSSTARLFGAPWLPTYWRWGYGRLYPRGYDE